MAGRGPKPKELPGGIESPTELACLLGVSRQRGDQLLHPDRRKARQAVKDALEIGELTRPTVCSQCGRADIAIQSHHPDYRFPLMVTWLCTKCHKHKGGKGGRKMYKIKTPWTPQAMLALHEAGTSYAEIAHMTGSKVTRHAIVYHVRRAQKKLEGKN